MTIGIQTVRVMKTLRKQTLQNGEGKSTSSQGDFHANRSASQVKEREQMITVTSGRTCSGLYGKSDPLGLLVKTLLESSRWYSPARRLKWDAKPLFSEKITEREHCCDKNTSSKPSVKTLSEKGIPSNRCLFRLVPSERHTEETESSLLPIVQTQGLKMCDKNGKTQFYPTELLPTPTSTDIHHAERVKSLKDAGAETMASQRNGSNRPNGLMDFMDFHEMLPTPVAMDAGSGRINKSNSPNAKERPTLALSAKMGLLPTPMASDATTGAIIGKNDHFITTGNGVLRKVNQNGTNGSVGLARMVQLLPTPNASEADKYAKRYNPKSQAGTSLTAMAMNGMLPTPTMRDYQSSVSPTALCRKDGRLRDDAICNIPAMIGEHCSQNGGKTSQLNPLFVEEMMGFPLMWVTLPFLSQDGDKNP